MNLMNRTDQTVALVRRGLLGCPSSDGANLSTTLGTMRCNTTEVTSRDYMTAEFDRRRHDHFESKSTTSCVIAS